jgi:hypothetical protein
MKAPPGPPPGGAFLSCKSCGHITFRLRHGLLHRFRLRVELQWTSRSSAFRFAHCDQLTGGLSPPSQCPCWAHILDRPPSRATTAGVRRGHILRQIRFSKSQLQTRLRDLAARCARGLHNLPPPGGRGECRMPVAPAASCAIVVIERTRVTTSTPESPDIPARNGFTAYVALSPVTGLFATVISRISFCLSPVGPTQLRKT